MDITELLSFTKQQGASDLHLSSGVPPTIRLQGTLRKLKMDSVTKEDVHAMIYDLMSDAQRKKFERELELDFSVSISGVARFRVNAFRQERGESAAFRIIPSESPTLSQMNMPPVIAECALKDKGLILVTGPTGSGKSTTNGVNCQSWLRNTNSALKPRPDDRDAYCR